MIKGRGKAKLYPRCAPRTLTCTFWSGTTGPGAVDPTYRQSRAIIVACWHVKIRVRTTRSLGAVEVSTQDCLTDLSRLRRPSSQFPVPSSTVQFPVPSSTVYSTNCSRTALLQMLTLPPPAAPLHILDHRLCFNLPPSFSPIKCAPTQGESII